MADKITIYPNYTRLLSVFARDGFMQPFRFQPYLNIYVSFSEYLKFCNICIDENIDIFTFALAKYKESINDVQMMRRLYYMDLSTVIVYEVIMSSCRHKESTVIRHIFDDAYVESIYDFEEHFETLPKSAIQKALDKLDKEISHYEFNTNLSAHNMNLLNYAMYLRALSYIKDVQSINIVEEIQNGKSK